jgi:hypothetical protein
MTMEKLPEVQQELWEAYLRVEGRGIRSDKLAALEHFIGALLNLPEHLWKDWARALAAEVVDGGAEVQIRMPLFERVLFPALLEGLDAGRPGCARWLAGLSQEVYRCRGCMERLGPERSTEVALLRKALAHDPLDVRSRRRLIEQMGWQLQHALHEVPSGVLYGMDGATPEQCDELLLELEEFRALLTAEGGEATCHALVRRCAYHFRAYKEYLLNRELYGGYEDFLDKRGWSGE